MGCGASSLSAGNDRISRSPAIRAANDINTDAPGSCNDQKAEDDDAKPLNNAHTIFPSPVGEARGGRHLGQGSSPSTINAKLAVAARDAQACDPACPVRSSFFVWIDAREPVDQDHGPDDDIVDCESKRKPKSASMAKAPWGINGISLQESYKKHFGQGPPRWRALQREAARRARRGQRDHHQPIGAFVQSFEEFSSILASITLHGVHWTLTHLLSFREGALNV